MCHPLNDYRKGDMFKKVERSQSNIHLCLQNHEPHYSARLLNKVSMSDNML